MTVFRDAMKSASEVINLTLGVYCLYRRENGSVVCKSASIIINKNIPITNDYGVLAGYRVEASILRSEVPTVIVGDKILDDIGDTWKVTMMIKETSSKWYVDLVMI